MYFMFTLKHKETGRERKYFFNLEVSNQKEADYMIDISREAIRRDLAKDNETRDMYKENTKVDHGDYRKFKDIINTRTVKFIEAPGFVEILIKNHNYDKNDPKQGQEISKEIITAVRKIDWGNLKDPYIPTMNGFIQHSYIPKYLRRSTDQETIDKQLRGDI